MQQKKSLSESESCIWDDFNLSFHLHILLIPNFSAILCHVTRLAMAVAQSAGTSDHRSSRRTQKHPNATQWDVAPAFSGLWISWDRQRKGVETLEAL